MLAHFLNNAYQQQKDMKKIITIASLSLLIVATIQAQNKDEKNIQKMLESKNFVFKAESANPARGRNRYLTSDYDLVVARDTVISFLPYFGRAYSAPVNPAEGGIKFTSSDFDYTLTKGKKESWEITIKPKDAPDIQDLYLTVFDNGKASLRVNSISRESISFNGYIKEGKEKERKAF